MVARNPCWAARAGAGQQSCPVVVLVLLRTSLSAVTTPQQPLQQSLVKHNELASDCCLVLVAIKTWNNQLHPHHQHQPSNCSLRGRVTILVSSNQLQLSLSASPCLRCVVGIVSVSGDHQAVAE